MKSQITIPLFSFFNLRLQISILLQKYTFVSRHTEISLMIAKEVHRIANNVFKIKMAFVCVEKRRAGGGRREWGEDFKGGNFGKEKGETTFGMT